jgi:hypothetical protein
LLAHKARKQAARALASKEQSWQQKHLSAQALEILADTWGKVLLLKLARRLKLAAFFMGCKSLAL